MHPNDGTMLTGGYYQYWFQFYTGPTNRIGGFWPPDLFSRTDVGESDMAAYSLQYALSHGYRHVLYQVRDKVFDDPAQMSGFKREKVFQNSSHALVLYSLPPGAEPARP